MTNFILIQFIKFHIQTFFKKILLIFQKMFVLIKLCKLSLICIKTIQKLFLISHANKI